MSNKKYLDLTGVENLINNVFSKFVTKKDFNNLQIGGRNLIIQKNVVNGYVANNGTLISGSAYRASDYIQVSPGDTLVFQMWMPSSIRVWIDDTYFDINKKYVTGHGGEYITTNHVRKIYTVPTGVSYIRVSYSWNDDFKVKLEIGNRATDWTLAPEDTDAKIDDISIGGRNLIKTTDLTVGWIDDTGALRYAGDWDKTFLTGEYISVDAGKEYMFQLFWTDNNTEAWIVYAYYNSNKEFIKVAPNDVYNTDKYYKEKIIIPSDVAYMRISWEFGAQRAVKLEKGNKATDWTAAPEDIDSAIETVSTTLTTKYSNLEQTLDGFKTTLDGKAPSSHTHTKSQITDFPNSMPASDVYEWAKASSKPSYSKSEVGLGNVDNTADANKSVKYAISAGSTTTATKATQDSAGQQINTTYIKSLSVSGKVITYAKGDGTTGTITTQDTNTTNTTGSTNTSSKIFLVGATSQAVSPVTYSHDTAYVGTDGCLYSNSTRVVSEVTQSTEPTIQKTGDYWIIEG